MSTDNSGETRLRRSSLVDASLGLLVLVALSLTDFLGNGRGGNGSVGGGLRGGLLSRVGSAWERQCQTKALQLLNSGCLHC